MHPDFSWFTQCAPPIGAPRRGRQAQGMQVTPVEGVAMTDSSPHCAPHVSAEGAWYLRPAAPGPSGVASLLGLFGTTAPIAQAIEGVTVSTRRVRNGSALFHEGMAADVVHVVAVGTFKCLHIAEDGYEQVLGFSGRGEVLGYDGLYSGIHPTAAVALEDSTVLILSQPDLATLRRRVPAFEQAFQRELSRQLMQRTAIASLMAAVSAEARLARFLVQLSDRMAEVGQSPRRLSLRMSRRDIASHIGVAHETVSRSFSALAQWHCLAVCNREVEILDAKRLRDCASSTRGLADTVPAGGCRDVPARQSPDASRCIA
jgi:CRP/FNR family transcriptional regulator, anaerobic regulatory protein